jgi:quinoprotein glucose dehydrogenase
MIGTRGSRVAVTLTSSKNTVVNTILTFWSILLLCSGCTNPLDTAPFPVETASKQSARAADVSGRNVDWPVYNGSAAGDHYSELSQIDRSNVNELGVAWRFDVGDGALETNPLIIGGTLYAYTPTQDVIALNAATGELKWKFDSVSADQRLTGGLSLWGRTNEQPARGLSYWTDGKENRLFVTGGTYLYALDPATGRIVGSFGEGGRIDLRKDLGRDYAAIPTFLTSPGIVYKDLIIVGFRTSETKPAAPGAVRAYDTRSGTMRWIFHLIPTPNEAGYETWPDGAWRTAGGANVWAGFALDETRGIVYAPTGSAVDDFYGADRVGDDLYSNSLVALNAETGRYLWHFQAVHHDLWDWDLPSPPVLLSVRHNGRSVDAVAQTSKHGFIFLFDRVTGTPLFPIEERPVPQSAVKGERTSPTQPFPVLPEPFANQRVTPDTVTDRTPEARNAALHDIQTMRTLGPFTPLGLHRETIVFPGFDGGAEWGGAAVDRGSGVIYVNSANSPSRGSLEAVSVKGPKSRGRDLYLEQCSVCHGLNREGAEQSFPRLVDVSERLNRTQITNVILRGRGRMPGFDHVRGPDVDAIVSYVSSSEKPPVTRSCGVTKGNCAHGVEAGETHYLFTGYKKWSDPDGYPAVRPPWGTLSAIDLNTGKYLWRVPLGEYPELSAQGVPTTGTENYGGPLVTASGLVFIGATVYDRKLRAFDSHTGKQVWEFQLPFAGVATPATYMIDGRQFLVIACSGRRTKNGPQGAVYMAFSLPSAEDGRRR